jgi:hypothetical protein
MSASNLTADFPSRLCLGPLSAKGGNLCVSLHFLSGWLQSLLEPSYRQLQNWHSTWVIQRWLTSSQGRYADAEPL